MNSLIIYAHPNPKSFNHAILETVQGRLKQLGHTCVTRDLYALNFNPVLKGSDFEAFKTGTMPADIAAEQGYIKQANTLIFIHPIWWFGMPAILKGYIDRVFSYGFAYAAKDGKITGLLNDKRIFAINTTGGAESTYNQAGFAQSLKTAIDNGIYGFCGMKIEKHIFFYEVPVVSDSVRKTMLEQVGQISF